VPARQAQPTDITQLSFGSDTKASVQFAFYSWTKGSKFKILGIGSANARGNTLVIIFDDSDVVKDYRITRGAAGASVVN
jgi:hypothetical protein